MEIINVNGDLLNSKAELLLQQVNCQGVMGSGVAKAIRDKWPVVFDKYKEMCDDWSDLLGCVLPVQVNDTQKVMNMFAQDNFGYDGERYTSYDAIDTCLQKVANYCKLHEVKTIALPYHMSCDRGGANWNIIMEMIAQHFKYLDVEIEIWKLN